MFFKYYFYNIFVVVVANRTNSDLNFYKICVYFGVCNCNQIKCVCCFIKYYCFFKTNLYFRNMVFYFIECD